MNIGGFTSLVSRRRSCRAYVPDRTVPRAVIRQCVEAARLAPSACNRQPWRFVVVDEAAVVRRLVNECKLPGIPHPWWEQVPVFVALCAELDLVTHRVAPAVSGIPYYLIDLGIAGEHFVLAAESAGLGTCWIGWFRQKAVKRLLGIPRSVRVGALITLGYPQEDGDTGAPSNRKPLEDILTWNAWNDQ
jgi:nitroreductase